MPQIEIVLRAGKFRQRPLLNLVITLHGVPRHGEDFRVFYVQIDLEGLSALQDVEAFHGVELVAVWRAVIVDPGLIVHADGVDDQSIALIMADRFSVPGRFYRFGMRHIEIDMPRLVVHLRDEQHLFRALHDIKRLGGIEQEGGNAHAPTADLAGLSRAAAGDPAISLFLTRLVPRRRVAVAYEP